MCPEPYILFPGIFGTQNIAVVDDVSIARQLGDVKRLDAGFLYNAFELLLYAFREAQIVLIVHNVDEIVGDGVLIGVISGVEQTFDCNVRPVVGL